MTTAITHIKDATNVVLRDRTLGRLSIESSTGVFVQDCIIRADKPPGPVGLTRYDEHGVNVGGCKDVWIDRCWIIDQWGDFVYVNGPDSNVAITNSILVNSGRQGITIVNGEFLTVETVHMEAAARYCFDFEPNVSSQHIGTARVSRVTAKSGATSKGFAVVHGGCCDHVYWLANTFDGRQIAEGDLRNRVL